LAKVIQKFGNSLDADAKRIFRPTGVSLRGWLDIFLSVSINENDSHCIKTPMYW